MMTEQAAGYGAGPSPGLELLAERMTRDPRTMAWVLAEYRHQEGMSHARLCELLDVTQEGYLRLALCLRPEPAQFAAHLRQITDYTGIDGTVLGNLIRQVDALGRLQPRTIEELQPGRGEVPAPGWQRQAMRSAARDRLQESQADYEELAALRPPAVEGAAAPAPLAAPQPESPPADATAAPGSESLPPDKTAHDPSPARGESPDDRPAEPPDKPLA
jgi:hypothetical protein